MKTSLLSVCALLLLPACDLVGAGNHEEPTYTILTQEENFEIRQYDPFIVAKTTVRGDFDESSKKAFRILADYIFGNNVEQTQMDMTAPVTQRSVKMDMTAPVTQRFTDEGFEMTFFMPSSYTLETLPTPLDDRVVIEEVPRRTVAVLVFAGTWSTENMEDSEQELRAWLTAQGQSNVEAMQAVFAGYNPPWTLPWLRRNEVMIQLPQQP